LSISYQIIISNNKDLFNNLDKPKPVKCSLILKPVWFWLVQVGVYNHDGIRKYIVFVKRLDAVLRFYLQANDTLRHKFGEWNIPVLDVE